MQLKSESAFSMIELLIVVAIIGMIASAVLASMSNARLKARDTKRLGALTSIQKALELAQTTAGYPGTASTTYVSGSGTCAGSFTQLNTLLTTAFIPEVPTDPTAGRCIYYIPSADSQGYRIIMQPEQSALLAKDHDCYTPTATWYCIKYSQ